MKVKFGGLGLDEVVLGGRLLHPLLELRSGDGLDRRPHVASVDWLPAMGQAAGPKRALAAQVLDGLHIRLGLLRTQVVLYGWYA